MFGNSTTSSSPMATSLAQNSALNEGKENAEPNLQQHSPSQASSSKARMISARLAEWKKRMGVEPTSEPNPSPSSSARTPRRENGEDELQGATDLVKETHPPHSTAANAPGQQPAGEQEDPANEASDASLLVLDFGAPSKPTARPGFVPGAHSRRLLAARAQKKQDEAARVAAAQPSASSTPLTPTPTPTSTVDLPFTHALSDDGVSSSGTGSDKESSSFRTQPLHPTPIETHPKQLLSSEEDSTLEPKAPAPAATIAVEHNTDRPIDNAGAFVPSAVHVSSPPSSEPEERGLLTSGHVASAFDMHGGALVAASVHDTHPLPTLGDVVDDAFDLDLSMCEDTLPAAPSPEENRQASMVAPPSPREGTESRGGEAAAPLLLQAQQAREWELRYREEHTKLESVQALLREYERDLELVLRQHEQFEHEQRLRLQGEMELGELKAELEGITDSFADIKRRYDEAKNLNESLRKNEGTLVEALHKAEEARDEAEARFEALRAHAEEKLAIAASEVQKVSEASLQAESSRQALDAALEEQSKLAAFWQARALIAEAKLPGLTQAIASKERENQELLAICDQLVASLQPLGGEGGSSSGGGATAVVAAPPPHSSFEASPHHPTPTPAGGGRSEDDPSPSSSSLLA